LPISDRETEMEEPHTQTFNDKVLDTVQALILGLHPDGSVAFFNDHCEQITGWSRKEALGKDWFTNFLPERQRPPVRAVFRDLIEAVEENEYENPILTRCGEERIVAWHNTVLRDELGEVALVLATGIDVTERRQAEDVLYPLNVVSLAVQQTHEPQEIFDIMGRKLNTLGFGCTVLLSNEDEDHLKIAFTTLSPKLITAAEKLLGLKRTGYRVPIERVKALKTACRDRRATLVLDTEETVRQTLPKSLARLAGQVTRMLNAPRFIAAPMAAGDALLGVLIVHSATLAEPHVPAVTAFANQVAVAIENARLFETERAQAQRQAALSRLSAELAATLEVDEVCQRVVNGLHDTLGYDLVGLLLVDETTGDRVSAAGAGWPQPPPYSRIPPGQGLSERPLLDGQLHYTPDVTRDPNHVHGLEGSEVDVPLRLGKDVLGVLVVESQQTNAFDQDDFKVLTAAANQAAVAIENARLFADQTRRRQEAEMLRQVTTALTSTLDLSEVLDLILERLQSVVPYESAAIGLLDGDVYRLAVAHNPNRANRLWGAGLSPDDLPLVARVVRERTPIIIADTHQSDDWVVIEGSERIRSWLGVPLVAKDQVIGLLMLNHSVPGFYDQRSGRLALAFAQHATIAIENARLHEAQQQQADELARLHRASATLFFGMTTDLPTLAQNIVEAVLREFGQANCSLLLLNPDTGELERIGAAGPYVPQVTQARLTLEGPGLVPQAVRTGEIVNVPDVMSHPNYAASWKEAQSEMAVPLQVSERVIGALDVQSTQRAAFGPLDERLLTNFAERAALAMENARLYQESQRRQAEAITLYEATRPIPSPDLSKVLETLAERASALTDLPRSIISLLESDGTVARVAAVRGYSEERAQALLGRLFGPQNYPTSWQKIFVEQQPQVVPNTHADSSPAPDEVADQSDRALLIVPLMAGDQPIGSLQLSGEARPLPDELVRRVETFAAQAAIAIENARLYSAVQEYARSLQLATWEKEQLLEQVQRHAEILEQEVAARTAEIFAEKEKVEAILKSAGDAIVITDTKGRLSFVNDAFTSLTGYAAQEAVSQFTGNILATNMTPPATLADFHRAAMQGVSWRGDIYVAHKDGHAIETEITLAPICDESGQVLSFVSSLRDVSQTRALERAKSEFLTNVSHQLRTPLTNLKTYAYLLDKGSPEKQAQYSQIVRDEVDKLLQLIQDLLEMVELDAGPIVSAWRSVSPVEIVTSTGTRYQSRATAAGLTLKVVTPTAPLPSVMGSQHRLAQALNQIVENALSFTAEGEVVVGVRLDDSKPDTAEIVIWVSDTGPGISREEQDKLFDRFFRGETAQPGHIPGTGLGLSVARMIVEAHGGRIEVQSTSGQGSTFEMRLPVSD
jgi:PAS domain S-box-containing protein